ncbi:MAG TPA: hypothetical protein VMV93_15360 [Chloroflexota bacterium]|nr:hypothetical protein [Chloroflexota bacterium]
MATEEWLRLRRLHHRVSGRWVSAQPLARYQPSASALSYKPRAVSVSVGEA